GVYTFAEDRHVRVDFLHAKLGPRGRAVVDIVGDLVLLLPFCAVVGWLSLRFVDLAYRSGELSDYGGLIDRYLVKAFLPIGLGLLFAAGFGRIIRNVGLLTSGRSRSGTAIPGDPHG
ncbi:MAG TPA: TRAP transporter small permease subunit, partial [Thalassobaculum sp.]